MQLGIQTFLCFPQRFSSTEFFLLLCFIFTDLVLFFLIRNLFILPVKNSFVIGLAGCGQYSGAAPEVPPVSCWTEICPQGSWSYLAGPVATENRQTQVYKGTIETGVKPHQKAKTSYWSCFKSSKLRVQPCGLSLRWEHLTGSSQDAISLSLKSDARRNRNIGFTSFSTPWNSQPASPPNPLVKHAFYFKCLASLIKSESEPLVQQPKLIFKQSLAPYSGSFMEIHGTLHTSQNQTIFNLYQLCSYLPSISSRREETGFSTRTERDKSLPQLCIICFFLCIWISKCSGHPTTLRQWDATYQLSPLVKVLLLSSSFFSTASSSTAVCSKSAETESWGEQEASCEDITFWTAKGPAFLVGTAPTLFPLEARKTRSLYTCVARAVCCAHGTQPHLCEQTWPSTPSYTSLCPCAATGWANRVPCTCKGKDLDSVRKFTVARWTVARVAKAHTSLTPDHIPQLREEQMAVSICPRTRAYL